MYELIRKTKLTISTLINETKLISDKLKLKKLLAININPQSNEKNKYFTQLLTVTLLLVGVEIKLNHIK